MQDTTSDLSYDTTETYIERQDYMISILRTKEVLPYIFANLGIFRIIPSSDLDI